MLTIKLAKIGKKNKKLFRVVICEKTQDPYGKALEILGSYNPYNKELVIKADRVKYWISKGSSMTPSVNNLLIEKKIIEGKKAVNSKPGTPNKRKAEKIEKAKQK
ncbi:MAG: 30S ribosomal protein S16, partial [Candidatus ainarchaeum sp.]|nr:30S ribosomal protein S16 [Candidatus ainarchaeum sp.]